MKRVEALKSKPAPVFVTVDQLAAETGLSTRLIRRLVAENKIVHLKSGKKILINKERAFAYLDNPTLAPAAEISGIRKLKECGR